MLIKNCRSHTTFSAKQNVVCITFGIIKVNYGATSLKKSLRSG